MTTFMTWEESRKKVQSILDKFILDFLDENSSRCLDDEDDKNAVAKYLEDHIPDVATELARAALGLKDKK